MKTKYFKFLSVFVAVIIAFSCFLLTVSAEVTSYEFVCNEPQISNNSCYFEIVQADGTAFIYYVTLSLDSSGVSGGGSEPFDRYSIYFNAYLDENKNLWVTYYDINTQGIIDGSTLVGVNIKQNGSIASGSNGNASCGIYVGWNFKCIRAYNCEFENSAGSDCVFVYGNDININNKLNDIIAILSNQNNSDIIANQDKNTDRLINAGSDVEQPDFNSANDKLDDTTNQMESIEGQYKIDEAATQDALAGGSNFLQGSDLQKASVQVKTWIEDFSSDNSNYTGFLVAAMCLGLCFWVIGRKAGSG